jgi:hypothetical protein
MTHVRLPSDGSVPTQFQHDEELSAFKQGEGRTLLPAPGTTIRRHWPAPVPFPMAITPPYQPPHCESNMMKALKANPQTR